VQFPNDSWGTPGRIGLPHPADELADLFGNRWTARRAWLAQLSPVVAKALALPGDHRPGLDEDQGIKPTPPKPGQPPPEHPIGPPEARAIDSLFVDRQLVPQGQVF